MNKNVDIALLEKYLEGEIGAQEVLDAEGKALNEQDLKAALSDYREATLGLEVAGFREGLQEAYERNQAPARSAKKPWWFAAAAVLLALAVVLLGPWGEGEPHYTEYFEPFEQYQTFRGADAGGEAAAFEAYSRGNYAEAFQLFQTIENPSESVQFYQGMSAMANHDFEGAIGLLESLGNDEAGEFIQQVRWYLGLAYWQAHQTDSAVSTLQLIKEGQFKYSESRDLIEALSD